MKDTHFATKKSNTRPARKEDLPLLYGLAQAARLARDTDYFCRHFEMQQTGQRMLLLAERETESGIAAYCVYNRQPKYHPFQKRGIPEIQDLFTFLAHRRQGYGRSLIEFCEAQALKDGKNQIGIGVGLQASFGPAQKLYVEMGYVPDGCGVTYDRMIMGQGEIRPLDDEFSLMMVKDL